MRPMGKIYVTCFAASANEFYKLRHFTYIVLSFNVISAHYLQRTEPNVVINVVIVSSVKSPLIYILIPFPTFAKHKLLGVIAKKEATDPRIPLGLVEVITSKVLP